MSKHFKIHSKYAFIVLFLIALNNILVKDMVYSHVLASQNKAISRHIPLELGANLCYLLRFKPYSKGKFRIKHKTNKSIAKRFKITGTGKLMHKRSCRQHLLRKLSNRHRRRLKRPVVIKSNKLRKTYLHAINPRMHR